MPDELDAALRRRFASAALPLEAEEFVAGAATRVAAARRWPFNARSPAALAATIAGGLATGLAALRLKHARLMVMGAAAVSVWVSLM
jgi:hypothetical protein